jgi:hypothetical protein
LKRIVAVSRSRWNCGSQGRKFSSISKMPVVYPLIQTASDSTWWRSPTLWMRAPRSGCIGRSGRTSTPKPYWKSSPSFSVSRVCLPCSPSIMIPALWGAHPGAISRSRAGALLVVPWGGTQCYPAASSRQEPRRREISSHARSRMFAGPPAADAGAGLGGDRDVSVSFQPPAAQPGAFVWQPTT